VLRASDEQIEKMMSDPNTGWWTEPETLIFGKSEVPAAPTDDVFAGIKPGPLPVEMHTMKYDDFISVKGDHLSIGGPWLYYGYFRLKHNLDGIPIARTPEIAVKAGTVVAVPLAVRHADAMAPLNVNLTVEVPAGWKIQSGQGQFTLPAEASTDLRVEVETPSLAAEELKKIPAREIVVKGEANGKSIGEVHLRVSLRANALPQ
jgi:hypothetical protein